MTLLDKYKELLKQAEVLAIENLRCTEQNGLLNICGTAVNAEVKNKLWDVYSQINPNFIANEVTLNVAVSPVVKGKKMRIVTEETKVNVRKGPSVELPIITNIDKDNIITLLGRANDYWWLIRTNNFEGYCYVQNMEPI